MKKVNETVLRETIYILAWVIILSAVTELIFLLIGKWNITVLWGNLLSAVAAVSNFFFMGLTVQSAVNFDEKKAAGYMKISQTLRMALLFVAAAVGVLLDCFNTITALIPLFFPRIAIAFRPLFFKKKNNKT